MLLSGQEFGKDADRWAEHLEVGGVPVWSHSLVGAAWQGIAVREAITKKDHGRVDCVLYVDQQAVGLIEAKHRSRVALCVDLAPDCSPCHQPDGSFLASSISTDFGSELEAGDVDGDGRKDVVAIKGSGPQAGIVSVYHQTEGGWTRTEHDTVRGYWPLISGLEVADVSGDGRADILATNSGNTPSSLLNVFRQNDDGTLSAPDVYTVYQIPSPVEAADINGDGRNDVVILHDGWARVSVLFQKPDGSLDTPILVPIADAQHPDAQALSIGDVDGDGNRDVAIAQPQYGLDLLRQYAGPASPGEQVWVRDVSPADFWGSVPLDTQPRVWFQRTLDVTSVNASSVRLVDGRTGLPVAATPSYDAGTNSVTLTPAVRLLDNRPYRIVVSGLRDAGGADQVGSFSTTFRTINQAPAAVGSFKAVGGAYAANLSWTLPTMGDLDQVIVRMAAGSTAPSSPSSGTGVYAGTGTTVRVSGLTNGVTYSFAVWVRDRTGALSPVRTAKLIGTSLTIAVSTTAVTYGGTVKITGRLKRTDTGVSLSNATVYLYGRRKGTTTWQYLTSTKTVSGGYLTIYHKPAWSLDYQLQYANSTAYQGSASSLRAVSVRPTISATLSASSVALGKSVTLSGTVSPAHPGSRVYLQRLSGGSWVSVTSTLLSGTSTYSFTIKPTTRGYYYYRVYLPGHTDHLYAVSATRTLRIT